MTPTADHNGYWLVASDGGVFAYGDAGFYGSIPGIPLHPAGSGFPHSLDAAIVGMVPTYDNAGYFMVASDGGVFSFGDAKFEGSCPGIGGCEGAAVAVMPDSSGNGYWVSRQAVTCTRSGMRSTSERPDHNKFPSHRPCAHRMETDTGFSSATVRWLVTATPLTRRSGGEHQRPQPSDRDLRG